MDIIQCIIFDNDIDSCKIIEQAVNKIKPLQIVKCCDSMGELMLTVSNNDIRFIFADITLMNSEDIKLLKSIKQDKIQIIVLSKDKETAADAFELDAIDFLLKPVSVARLMKTISKIARQNMQYNQDFESKRNTLFVKDKGRLIRLYMDDIYLIEALADYVNIYTPEKKYTVHTTMKKIEAELPNLHFLRVHKSYIVNADQIKEIKNDVIVIGNRSIPVGQSYKKDLVKKLKVF